MNGTFSHRGCYLAEWYRAGLTASVVDDAIADLGSAAAARLLILMAAPRDDVLYGVFLADSSVDVQDACRAAGYPVERITADVGVRVLADGLVDGGNHFRSGSTEIL